MDVRLDVIEKGTTRDAAGSDGIKGSVIETVEELPMENIIIFRFVSLQLKRIGRLQEELIKLGEQSNKGEESEGFNKLVDETLQRYCKSSTDKRKQLDSKLTTDFQRMQYGTTRPCRRIVCQPARQALDY